MLERKQKHLSPILGVTNVRMITEKYVQDKAIRNENFPENCGKKRKCDRVFTRGSQIYMNIHINLYKFLKIPGSL